MNNPLKTKSRKILICCAVVLTLAVAGLVYAYKGAISSSKLRSFLSEYKVNFKTITLELFDFDTKAFMKINSVEINGSSLVDSRLGEELSSIKRLHHLEVKCDQSDWDELLQVDFLPSSVKRITLGNTKWFDAPVVLKSNHLNARVILNCECRILKLVGVDLAKSDIDLEYLILHLDALSLSSCVLNQDQVNIINAYKQKDRFRDKIIITERGNI
jgi:hypothetical protein